MRIWNSPNPFFASATIFLQFYVLISQPSHRYLLASNIAWDKHTLASFLLHCLLHIFRISLLLRQVIDSDITSLPRKQNRNSPPNSRITTRNQSLFPRHQSLFPRQLPRPFILPQFRNLSVINNAWSPYNPSPVLSLLNSWSPLLPGFIYNLLLEQVVIPKLRRAIDHWNPRRNRELLPIILRKCRIMRLHLNILLQPRTTIVNSA